MIEVKTIEYSIDTIQDTIKALLPLIDRYRVVTFTGPLGAGKTTLIRALAEQLGIKKDAITSPTFTYVNIYRMPNNKRLYHFDLYRITSSDQFQEMGFDEYLFDPEGTVFIEWPEIIQPLLEGHCAVAIDYHHTDPDKRVMKIIGKN